MANKHRSFMGLFTAAIGAMLGRTTSVQTRPPKDSYVNTPPTPILKCKAFGTIVGIDQRSESYQGTQQRKARKNRRRAFAAGDKKAFC